MSLDTSEEILGIGAAVVSAAAVRRLVFLALM